MERKPGLDGFGVLALGSVGLVFGLNNVLIKLVNEGLQPVFFAGLRSVGAVACIGLWMWWRGLSPRLAPQDRGAGLLIGGFFAAEFLLLFIALDFTTVVRSAIVFYSMPVWLALAAHFLLPGERLTWLRSAGLVLAMGGVVLALADRDTLADGRATLIGDICALGAALCWAGIVLTARMTRLREYRPETQLFWQVAVSAPVLLLAAPFYGGEMIRELVPLHVAAFAFQTVVVVSGGFIFWFWLLMRYPASTVASFSFLTPVIAVALGWLLLNEPVGPAIFGALALVVAGITLINRPLRTGRSGG